MRFKLSGPDPQSGSTTLLLIQRGDAKVKSVGKCCRSAPDSFNYISIGTLVTKMTPHCMQKCLILNRINAKVLLTSARPLTNKKTPPAKTSRSFIHQRVSGVTATLSTLMTFIYTHFNKYKINILIYLFILGGCLDKCVRLDVALVCEGACYLTSTKKKKEKYFRNATSMTEVCVLKHLSIYRANCGQVARALFAQ